jgi:hypothetical protein
MEISDFERVEIRRDVERIQLRGLETRASAIGREVQESRAKTERVETSFKSVCEKFLAHSRELKDPKLQSLALREGLKRVQQEKKELTQAQSKLAVLTETQGKALAELATGKVRFDKLGDALATLVRRKAQAGEVSQEQAVNELMGAVRLARSGKEKVEGTVKLSAVSTREDLEKDTRSIAEAVAATKEKQGLEQADSATQPESVKQREIDPSNVATGLVHLSRQGEGGTQDSSGQSSRQQPQPENTLQEQLRSAGYGSSVKAGDFAERLSGLESWSDSRGAGVSFSFSSSEGRKLNVQLTHLPDKGTVVSLAPESLAEQHLMGRALREVKNSIERQGMKVAGAHVGAVQKGDRRG